ncbi:hypothetical protein RJG79_04855 [Mycoplasmatota bacterium WC44]
MKDIDFQRIKVELEQKHILTVQKRLTIERRKRMIVMSSLLSALIFTVIYGTIQNPFIFTFSKIGNRFLFGNRVLFIIWAIFTGIVIQSATIALFRLEKYQNKRVYIYIGVSTIFLIFTSMAPSLEKYPFWTWIHIFTAGFFALFLTVGFYPFIIWVARENPRLRRNIYIWISVIWGGGVLWMFLLGNTGVFELWFFSSFIIFLLYLSLTLFEESIVKTSIILLKDEDNPNLGIEKIFVDLEKVTTTKTDSREYKKDEKSSVA